MCAVWDIFIAEDGENLIFEMDWKWVPRVNPQVKMSHYLKICQIGLKNRQTY